MLHMIDSSPINYLYACSMLHPHVGPTHACACAGEDLHSDVDIPHVCLVFGFRLPCWGLSWAFWVSRSWACSWHPFCPLPGCSSTMQCTSITRQGAAHHPCSRQQNHLPPPTLSNKPRLRYDALVQVQPSNVVSWWDSKAYVLGDLGCMHACPGLCTCPSAVRLVN